MNLSTEVSSIETELSSLRVENELLKHGKALHEFEVNSLRRAVDKLQAERDNFMRRAEALKTLLDQTGASLVTGINKYHENERELQAQQLGDDTPPPKFLTKPNGNGEHAEYEHAAS